MVRVDATPCTADTDCLDNLPRKTKNNVYAWLGMIGISLRSLTLLLDEQLLIMLVLRNEKYLNVRIWQWPTTVYVLWQQNRVA